MSCVCSKEMGPPMQSAFALMSYRSVSIQFGPPLIGIMTQSGPPLRLGREYACFTSILNDPPVIAIRSPRGPPPRMFRFGELGFIDATSNDGFGVVCGFV